MFKIKAPDGRNNISGKKVKQYRLAKKMSQYKLAAKIQAMGYVYPADRKRRTICHGY